MKSEQGRINLLGVNGEGRTRLRENGVNAHLPHALHNDFDTQVDLQREKPVHRQMQELARLGHTNKEIAAATGYAPNYISSILRQPWARENMIAAIRNDTQAELKAALESFAPKALNNILRVASNPLFEQQDPKNFAAVNQDIINRVLGKPTQPLDHHITGNPDNLTDEELLSIANRGAAPATNGHSPSEPDPSASSGVRSPS